MFAILLLSIGAEPAQFKVENRAAPAFVVVNKTTQKKVAPTDPSKPAPSGYQWQKWPGEDWKLYPLEVSRQAVPFGRDTTVRSAVAPSTSSPGSTAMGRTHTLVLPGTRGVTNCDTGG